MNGLVKQCSKEKKTNFENVRTSTSQYENVIFLKLTGLNIGSYPQQ